MLSKTEQAEIEKQKKNTRVQLANAIKFRNVAGPCRSNTANNSSIYQGIGLPNSGTLSLYSLNLTALVQLAQKVIEAGKLSTELVDILIERVYIYPENRIEIVWKTNDFTLEAPNLQKC